MQKITPFLWFDDQAEEAANFYVSIFAARGENSRIRGVTRYGKEGARAAGRPEESAMTVAFQLLGQEFTAINGGPVFKFSPAVSFVVNCETQEELDYYWEKLSAGGDEKAQQCGWLQDKYGLSWQIVPTALGEMLQAKDPKKSESVMKAVLQMKKLDIEILRRAYDQA